MRTGKTAGVSTESTLYLVGDRFLAGNKPKFLREYQPLRTEGIVKEKTRENVYKAFIGEAKAYFRLLAYAEKSG